MSLSRAGGHPREYKRPSHNELAKQHYEKSRKAEIDLLTYLWFSKKPVIPAQEQFSYPGWNRLPPEAKALLVLATIGVFTPRNPSPHTPSSAQEAPSAQGHSGSEIGWTATGFSLQQAHSGLTEFMKTIDPIPLLGAASAAPVSQLPSTEDRQPDTIDFQPTEPAQRSTDPDRLSTENSNGGCPTNPPIVSSLPDDTLLYGAPGANVTTYDFDDGAAVTVDADSSLFSQQATCYVKGESYPISDWFLTPEGKEYLGDRGYRALYRESDRVQFISPDDTLADVLPPLPIGNHDGLGGFLPPQHVPPIFPVETHVGDRVYHGYRQANGGFSPGTALIFFSGNDREDRTPCDYPAEDHDSMHNNIEQIRFEGIDELTFSTTAYRPSFNAMPLIGYSHDIYDDVRHSNNASELVIVGFLESASYEGFYSHARTSAYALNSNNQLEETILLRRYMDDTPGFKQAIRGGRSGIDPELFLVDSRANESILNQHDFSTYTLIDEHNEQQEIVLHSSALEFPQSLMNFLQSRGWTIPALTLTTEDNICPTNPPIVSSLPNDTLLYGSPNATVTTYNFDGRAAVTLEADPSLFSQQVTCYVNGESYLISDWFLTPEGKQYLGDRGYRALYSSEDPVRFISPNNTLAELLPPVPTRRPGLSPNDPLANAPHYERHYPPVYPVETHVGDRVYHDYIQGAIPFAPGKAYISFNAPESEDRTTCDYSAEDHDSMYNNREQIRFEGVDELTFSTTTYRPSFNAIPLIGYSHDIYDDVHHSNNASELVIVGFSEHSNPLYGYNTTQAYALNSNKQLELTALLRRNMDNTPGFKQAIMDSGRGPEFILVDSYVDESTLNQYDFSTYTLIDEHNEQQEIVLHSSVVEFPRHLRSFLQNRGWTIPALTPTSSQERPVTSERPDQDIPVVSERPDNDPPLRQDDITSTSAIRGGIVAAITLGATGATGAGYLFLKWLINTLSSDNDSETDQADRMEMGHPHVNADAQRVEEDIDHDGVAVDPLPHIEPIAVNIAERIVRELLQSAAADVNRPDADQDEPMIMESSC